MSMNVEISRISRILTVNIQWGGDFRDLIFHGRGTRGFKELSVITFLFLPLPLFLGAQCRELMEKVNPDLFIPGHRFQFLLGNF